MLLSFLRTIVLAVCLAIITPILPVTEIIVGAVFIKACPYKPVIPLWLAVDYNLFFLLPNHCAGFCSLALLRYCFICQFLREMCSPAGFEGVDVQLRHVSDGRFLAWNSAFLL